MKYLLSSTCSLCLLVVAAQAVASPIVDNTIPLSPDVAINQAGNTTMINVTADKAIINWKDFSIAENETVNFQQLSDTSVTLNRVTGTNVSKIYGNLTANGKIFLVNPNGIVFGKSANINVGSLLASTTDITDANFLAGNYKFDQVTNPNASIVFEKGSNVSIKAAGFAAVVSPSVQNLGIIQADLNKLVLASGDVYTLDLYGDHLIEFDASSTLKKANVTNAGEIVAMNSTADVILTAAAVDDLLESTINVTGYIEAHHVTLSGDKVTLGPKAKIVSDSTDVYYSTKNYSKPIDYAKLIGGKVTSYMWIHNAADLRKLDTYKANKKVLSNNFALSNDIDLDNQALNPIGGKNNAFSGIFDFNGHEIQDLNVTSKNYAGLFAKLNNATIIDVNINGATVKGTNYVGVLAGEAINTTFVNDINIENSKVSGKKFVGDVVGLNKGAIYKTTTPVVPPILPPAPIDSVDPITPIDPITPVDPIDSTPIDPIIPVVEEPVGSVTPTDLFTPITSVTVQETSDHNLSLIDIFNDDDDIEVYEQVLKDHQDGESAELVNSLINPS